MNFDSGADYLVRKFSVSHLLILTAATQRTQRKHTRPSYLLVASKFRLHFTGVPEARPHPGRPEYSGCDRETRDPPPPR